METLLKMSANIDMKMNYVIDTVSANHVNIKEVERRVYRKANSKC